VEIYGNLREKAQDVLMASRARERTMVWSGEAAGYGLEVSSLPVAETDI
jgi:hypothetical protein